MAGSVEQSDMILLMDRYDKDSESLHTSFRLSGNRCPAVVIEDDGFLPDDVMSVYGFFLGDFKEAEGLPGRPRYFNEITVPSYWEISANNSSGKVHDLTRERGRIFYTEPLHKRLVRIVDWIDERGVVRCSEHYNRYGAVWARTIFNEKGQQVNKSYFSAGGQEVIMENLVTGDIILNEGNEVRFFQNKTDFVLYFLEKAGYLQKRLYFNSLSTPFFVSQRMTAGEGGGDVLFWQEPARPDIPGNMKIILNGQASRTNVIYVQKKYAYDKLMALGANPEIVHMRGFVYPYERESAHRPEVLICTNSDRVEHLSEFAKALPQFKFHVAALTEMSQKLLNMGDFENVSLYPGVKQDILSELFEKCDLYFDVNHESEIVSAVRRAFLNNQLIFAFRETLHNADYVAEEHIYPAADVARMTEDIKNITARVELWDERLRLQRKAALSEEKY